MTETPENIPQAIQLLYDLKMANGDEVLCTLVNETEFGILIECPIQVRHIPISDGNGSITTQLMTSKWITFSSSDLHFIDYKQIVSYQPMIQAAHKMYVNAVNRYSVNESDAAEVNKMLESNFFIDCNNTVN